MRLTLRTLLAYMDDRLPPANAKELGQKVANSPFATELVERIRDVKRRRRLAIPDKPVAMIEANLIAEYLDDQLTPELVARIEKEILASDAMLAEVASAHEILGMLSDPVTIEPQLRDRLYALDPTGKTDVARALGGEKSGTPTAPTAEWKPLPVPGQSVRRVPMLLVAGLAMVWLITVVSDPDLIGPKTDPPIVADVPIAAAKSDPVEDPIVPDEAVVVAKNDVEPGKIVADPDKVENTVVATSGSVPEPEVDTPPNDPSSTVAPVVDPEKPIITEVPNAKVEPENAIASVQKRKPVCVMTNNKTFFMFDESIDRWMRLDQIPGGEIVSTTRNTSDGNLLFQQHWISVPEPFIANLSAVDRGWNATLHGTLLGRLASGDGQGMEVYSGRIKVTVDAMQPWAEDRMPAFSLRTGGVTSILVLQSQDAVVGVEVKPLATTFENRTKSDVDPHAAATLLHLNGSDALARVTVMTGQVIVQLPGIEQKFTLSKGKSLSWLAPQSKDPAVPSKPENITPDDGSLAVSMPTWLRSEEKPVPEAEALNSATRTALASGDDPALSVIPLLSDRNPQLGVRAVHILTATHDVDRLLSALFENLDESVHQAAIDGLSYLANGSVDGLRTIQIALETRIPMSEVGITLSLIKGFGDAEARDAAYCQQLIDLLNNDRLATRTLAFYRIQQYSNDRLGYQPEAESSRRRDAVRRWQKFLERNGGKLLL